MSSGLVTIEVTGDAETDVRHRRLEFPRALVEQADSFDNLLLRVSEAIENGYDPRTALDDAGIDPGHERNVLETTVASLLALHQEGRNHVWAYYTRNLVRPLSLSSSDGQVDVIVGNPPWLTYNRTDATLRTELERQSKDLYGIWVGGQYAPHQDIAGLFFTRCVDLYLRRGGIAAMVLPHSALQAGQYREWRRGTWSSPKAAVDVDFSTKVPWDLEQIKPNSFFPVPACVVFARKVDPEAACPLGDRSQRWRGPEGGPFTHETASLTDTSGGEFASPYGDRAHQGATIVPRALFFVEVSKSPTAIAGGIVRVSPRRSSQEKAPWKQLKLEQLVDAHIERGHVWEVYLGECVAPYVLLEPRQAVLPIRAGNECIAYAGSEDAICGIDPAALDARMRSRWRAVNELWDKHKSTNNRLRLIERLDYLGGLRNQVGADDEFRVVYTTSGRPTACMLDDPRALIDNTLYWISCAGLDEARYLSSIVNSDVLRRAVERRMPMGQFGARHLHRHLWHLPIPAFDSNNDQHTELAAVGAEAAESALALFTALQAERASQGKTVSTTVVRSELRAWLEQSPLGNRIDGLVARLLEQNGA